MIMELCESKFVHAPFEKLSDKGFLKKHNSTDIVCTECLQHWMEDCATILAREIRRKVIPIYDNLDKLFVNKGFEDMTFTPGFIGNKCVCQMNHDSHDHDPKDKHHGHHRPDYEIIEEPSKDIYPWIPEKDDRFINEDIYKCVQMYHGNFFKTNFTVELPDYMKYILCSNADIHLETRFTDDLGLIAVATVTFYGPCERPESDSDPFDCSCSAKPATWTPVAKLMSPKEPLHEFRLEIYTEDLAAESRLMHRIYIFMNTCIGVTFDPIPTHIVKALMDEKFENFKNHHSMAPTGPVYTCSKCGRSDRHDHYYLYNRTQTLCLECAYKEVVKLATDANLAEAVGLATGKDTYSVEYLYRRTRAWKHAVIGRYINALKEAGGCPEIRPLYHPVDF